MVSLNTSYLVIKVNVLGHFNIIAAILNKKLLVTICAKTSCWKARSIPLNVIIPTSQEPNSYFSTSTSPCLASANVKLGYYHSIFAGVSAEDITISARYCSFIMSLWWLGFFSHSICELQWCPLRVLNKFGQLPAHTDTWLVSVVGVSQ